MKPNAGLCVGRLYSFTACWTVGIYSYFEFFSAAPTPQKNIFNLSRVTLYVAENREQRRRTRTEAHE